MNSPLHKFPLLALFFSFLLAAFNMLTGLAPIFPYLTGKEDVQMEMHPAFYHVKGIVILKVTIPLLNPEIQLRGRGVHMDSAWSFDSHSNSLPLAFEANKIRLTDNISADSLYIAYTLKMPTKIDNVVVSAGKRSWDHHSQRAEAARREMIHTLINVGLATLIIIAAYLHQRDLRQQIYGLKTQSLFGVNPAFSDQVHQGRILLLLSNKPQNGNE